MSGRRERTRESAIYAGRIRHRRFTDHEHSFAYPLHMVYLDLDELPELLGGRLLRARPGIVRFRRPDYLGDPEARLGDAVRDVVAEHTGSRPTGPVRLLTNLRGFGHCFNPVSFYYCFSEGGVVIEAVAAEVTSTPWGERHTYVVPAGESASGVVHGSSEKRLHVSPFMGMDHSYRWSVSRPGQGLQVHIESHRAGRLAFDATLSLRRRELTRASLARTTASQPAMSLRVLGRIYAQALRLRLKGATVHPHPRLGAR